RRRQGVTGGRGLPLSVCFGSLAAQEMKQPPLSLFKATSVSASPSLTVYRRRQRHAPSPELALRLLLSLAPNSDLPSPLPFSLMVKIL
ncbi:hypothetical protein U1Q18_039431, partial [Sarracenia purpurea var. burkii]